MSKEIVFTWPSDNGEYKFYSDGTYTTKSLPHVWRWKWCKDRQVMLGASSETDVWVMLRHNITEVYKQVIAKRLIDEQ